MAMRCVALLLLLPAPASAQPKKIDAGPTYGKDWSGDCPRLSETVRRLSERLSANPPQSNRRVCQDADAEQCLRGSYRHVSRRGRQHHGLAQRAGKGVQPLRAVGQGMRGLLPRGFQMLRLVRPLASCHFELGHVGARGH